MKICEIQFPRNSHASSSFNRYPPIFFLLVPGCAGFYLPYVWLELVGLPAMPESTENKLHPRLRIRDIYSGALIKLQGSHFQASEWLQHKLNFCVLENSRQKHQYHDAFDAAHKEEKNKGTYDIL